MSKHWLLGVLPLVLAVRVSAQEKGRPVEQALAEFRALYALPEGEVLKRVSPPFSDTRLIYYRHHDSTQAEAIPGGPQSMFFHWQDGKLRRHGMHFTTATGADLRTILRMLAEIYPHEVEGDREVLRTGIKGDFILRVGTPADKVVARLQAIVKDEIPLKMEFCEVGRRVFVARGRFDFKPLGKDRDQIEIYGETLNKDPNIGGGGSGDFNTFLQWVSMWIEQPVVSGVEDPPKGTLRWHYNQGDPVTPKAKDAELVLKNLTTQTGLTFDKETRKVRVLFVEPAN